MRTRLPAATCLAATLLLVGCGGDDGSTADETADAAEAPSSAAEVPSPTDDPTEVEAETPARDSVDDPGAEGGATLVAWTWRDDTAYEFEGECFHEPDRDDLAAQVMVVDARDADETPSLSFQAFRGFTEEDRDEIGTSGLYVDEDENLFAIVEYEADGVGSDVTIELGLHDGVKTVDDPADFTITVTCSG